MLEIGKEYGALIGSQNSMIYLGNGLFSVTTPNGVSFKISDSFLVEAAKKADRGTICR